MTKIISLTQGHETIVDANDYEWLSHRKWHFMPGDKRSPRSSGYAATSIHCKNVMIHRIIMDAPIEMEVDHINGNGLDNRRQNLRLATRSQNAANLHKKARAKSGYLGVHKDGAVWRAELRHQKKYRYLGRFKTAEDAARARDAEAFRLWGEFACLNF